ncbi:phytanoyl-CoA dioxygenase family protein [Streptomyces sp. NPDC006285]|uniref:phytanoyl-CoA dioxygenase family protein n=1 Tax=Streptomyces sp. NPDC006285 TaxID=3364742 RepID=UPI0036CDC1D6
MLKRFSFGVSAAEVEQCMREEGYAIVDNLVDPEVIKRVSHEMMPYIDKTPTGLNNFVGRKTRRTGALIARSPAAREIVMNPLALDVTGRFLGHASEFQLHLTQVISLDPGQQAQKIHRDEAWDHYPFPMDYDVLCNTMWAMSDFTPEAGATLLVPRTHLIPGEHDFEEKDALVAEMEPGSVLFYTGKIYHAGGANRTQDRVRHGLNINYSVGWVRQEENHYLSTPREIAATLDDDLLKVMGYQLGGPALGWIRDFEHPLAAVREGADDWHLGQ